MHFVIPESVSVRADKMYGYKNPYITLTDLIYLCQGNETLEFCLDELINYSLRYTETVLRFEQIIGEIGQGFDPNGAREEIERVRSTVHDSTIDAINKLSRTMKQFGKNNSWIASLTSGQRAAYGKFAILIAFEASKQPQEEYGS